MNVYPSVRALHHAYKKGEITPLAYTQFLLDRIEKEDIARGTFTVILKERALKEAKHSTERWENGQPLGLFDGIPTVWKDLFDIKGEITTGGSSAYLDAKPASQDAKSVEFYSKNGGINLGKVGLSEFAYSALGINPELGTPMNAYPSVLASSSEKRVPGGSSSGTAVAVSKGIVSVGIGTDTSGSIRIPAAWHGLYGYKPSIDFYDDTDGIMPLSTTLDTFGPIAQTLQDCYDFYCLFQKRPFSLLADIPEKKEWQEKKSRYVIPSNIVNSSIDADVLEVFEVAITKLEASGFIIEREEIGLLDEVHRLMSQYGTFAAAESSYYHQLLLKDERREKINPRVLDRMARSDEMSAVDYVALYHLRQKLIKDLQVHYKNTIFLIPTVPMEAPLLEPLEQSDELFHRTNLKAMSLTVIGNFLAWDSITIPMGVGKEGMPLGMMISNAGCNITELFKKSYEVDAVISKL